MIPSAGPARVDVVELDDVVHPPGRDESFVISRFRRLCFGQTCVMAITEQTFNVSASTLFDTLVNPDTYPYWLVGARNIRDVSADWPQPDSYFKHTVGFGPIAIPDRTTVRCIDRPRTLEMLVRARPVIEAIVRFEVTSSLSGCTLRMEETPVGVYKVFSVVAQPVIRARNDRSMKRLRSFIEDSDGATAKGA